MARDLRVAAGMRPRIGDSEVSPAALVFGNRLGIEFLPGEGDDMARVQAPAASAAEVPAAA